MDWLTIAQLIIKEGLPLAESLWQKWSANTVPTQKDFDDLKAKATQTAQDRTKVVLAALGIPLTDPRAVALLGLSSGS
jgi:hypothetical protein